jgi:hypothetical protein
MGFTDGIYAALKYFLAAAWIVAMYRLGKELHRSNGSRLKTFLIILSMSSVLGLLRWSNLRTHVEGADPVTGRGDVVADYEPSAVQRNRAATLIFLLSFLPASVSLLNRGESRKSISKR